MKNGSLFRQTGHRWHSRTVKTALLWKGSMVRECTCEVALLHLTLANVFSIFSQKDTVLSLCWKGKVCSQSQVWAGLLDRETSSWSLIGLSSCNEDSESLHFGPKGPFLIGQNRAAWLARAMQLWLVGKSLSPIGWNRIPQNLSQGKNTMQAGSLVQRPLHKVQFVERPLSRNGC